MTEDECQIRLREFGSVPRIGFNWLIVLLCMVLPPGRIKNWLYRRMGAKVDRTCFISPLVILDPVFPQMITIEQYAVIGFRATIWTHMLSPTRTRPDYPRNIGWQPLWEGGEIKYIWERNGAYRKILRGKVTIGLGAFVGGDTVIQPCCKIGDTAVVGCNSLVIHHTTVPKGKFFQGTTERKTILHRHKEYD